MHASVGAVALHTSVPSWLQGAEEIDDHGAELVAKAVHLLRGPAAANVTPGDCKLLTVEMLADLSTVRDSCLLGAELVWTVWVRSRVGVGLGVGLRSWHVFAAAAAHDQQLLVEWLPVASALTESNGSSPAPTAVWVGLLTEA